MRGTAGWMGALVVALLAAAPAMSRQEKKGCPMATKEPGFYCEKCTAVLKKDEIKDGKCAKDGSDPLKAEVCVKKHYICDCGKNCCPDDKPTAGKCKCGKALKEDLDRRLIGYTCQGCGGQSVSRDKVIHSKDCKSKNIKAACGHP